MEQDLFNNKNSQLVPDLKLWNGNNLPQVGLGTWTLKNQVQIDKCLEVALNSGYRLIDSAVMYDNEIQIGLSLKKLGVNQSDKVQVTTKILPEDLSYEKTLNSVQNSLKNLQTSQIDLILLHWPGAQTLKDRKESYKALEECCQKGYIKNIGVSNFLPRHIESLEYQIKPCVNQIEIHPYLIDEKTIQFCKEQNIVLEAYSPLAIRDSQLIQEKIVQELANKYKKSCEQIILRWGIQNQWNILPRSSNPEHIKQNIDLFEFQLEENEIQSISKLNKNYRTDWNPYSVE